jgi:hypothetical protein
MAIASSVPFNFGISDGKSASRQVLVAKDGGRHVPDERQSHARRVRH